MPQAAQKGFSHYQQASATVALLALLVPGLTGQVQPITNIIATSAANFEVGVSQHGSISAIFCLGLQGIQGTVAANTVPLPRELAGVRVTIGGAAAPLFSVSAVNGYFQINVQTPLEAQFDERWDPKRVDVRIEQVAGPDQSRVAEGAATLPLRPNPGEFFMLSFGQRDSARVYGQPAVFRASDFSLITSANPARRKDTLVAFATGLAPTEPVVPTGVAAPFAPLAQVPFIDGWPPGRLAKGTYVLLTSLSVRPLYVGLAPGLVGVYQINFGLSGDEVPYDGVLYLRLARLECPPGSFGCRASGTTYWQSKSVLLPYSP